MVFPERRTCAVSFEALSKWSNYLSVLVEAEDMSPWTGTTEDVDPNFGRFVFVLFSLSYYMVRICMMVTTSQITNTHTHLLFPPILVLRDVLTE